MWWLTMVDGYKLLNHPFPKKESGVSLQKILPIESTNCIDKYFIAPQKGGANSLPFCGTLSTNVSLGMLHGSWGHLWVTLGSPWGSPPKVTSLVTFELPWICRGSELASSFPVSQPWTCSGKAILTVNLTAQNCGASFVFTACVLTCTEKNSRMLAWTECRSSPSNGQHSP